MPATLDPAAPTTAPLTPTQCAALDDPARLDGFTRWIDGAAPGDAPGDTPGRTGQSRLLLSGMYCAACAGVIEHALQGVPGVLRAEVSAASQRATVVWDARRVRPSQMIEAVRAKGYGAFPDTGAQAVQLHAREARASLWRLFVAGFCMMQVMMYATPAYVAAPGELSADMAQLLRWASWVLSIPVLVFAAGPYFRGAWQALRTRRIGMDVPVTLGIVVTFVASSIATFNPVGAWSGEVYFDSLTMFVCFLLAARALETRARSRAAQALDAVMRRLPDSVERIDAGGRSELVASDALRVGDRVRVHAGQAFAADGVVLEGITEADESVLSGESRPVARGVGDAVSAGCINLQSPVLMQVLGIGAQTRYQRIVSLVERALTERPALMRSADRVAAPFLWIVLALAIVAFVAWQFIDPARALWVAVSVLIVTCPCALSLGAPVALIAATGQLARQGVLVQRVDALEVLSHVDDVVFDKTGTLTEDRLVLADSAALVPPTAFNIDTGWLRFAASLATRSTHPLSKALVTANEDNVAHRLSDVIWQDIREVPGQGLQANRGCAGRSPDAWRLGSPGWCGVDPQEVGTASRPSVWLARANGTAWQPVARFEFDEQLRADAAAAVRALRDDGLQLHLLSGDQAAAVQVVAARLGIDDVRAQATPQDKLEAIDALQRAGRSVVMVGDGINDAPVLARADVSIAMGSAAALAQARADVIVLGNRLGDIVLAVHLARRTLRIVRQNLRWAVLYNLACVPLAMLGLLPPWLAGIGMASSSLLVVLNALRLTRNLRRGESASPLRAPLPVV